VTSYEGFYGGGFSALSPDYGNLTGYRMSAANLGFPGSPQSANQVQDVINAIKHGTKTFEVTMLQPDVGESIPRQHFEEMRALMKLTGVKPSVHGPLIDAAGFGERGWEPGAREDGERRMFAAIEKAQILDPSGNLPFVIHAANGAPGTEWRPGDEKKGEGKYVMERGVAINQETGQAVSIKREFKIRPEHPELFERGGKVARDDKGKPIWNKDMSLKYDFIEGEKGLLYDAEGSIGSINEGEWANKLTEVAQMSKHVEEIMGAAPIYFRDNYVNAVVSSDGKKIFEMGEDGKFKKELEFKDEQRVQYEQMQKADVFMQNAELSFAGAFGQAYKYGTEEQKKALKELAEGYVKSSAVGGYFKVGDEVVTSVLAPLQKHHNLSQSFKKLQEITDRKAPELFKSGEAFAMEKAAETFGNLAAKSWDNWKEKAPVLAVENMMIGQYAFARAEDMRELIGKSRDNFTKQLIERGVDEKKAAKLAKDKLGVTWDVGHLNLMRKKGFTTEDIVEQTKIISGTDKKGGDKSMVKHIHLTDNFGYADTHLVPGMGNVPVKAILEELEKTGRFDEMRKITEAGGMIQHFKKLPHSMTLAAFGSGIYGMKNGPTWGAAMDMQGSYFGGYGNLNPQIHHSYFGAGFTTMPVELGGQQVGGGSRFGGTPMA